MCGDSCPVEGFETRRTLRCGDFVETQFFTYAKGANDWNVGICCYCCSPDDLLTVDQMKETFDCGGQQPLRLCESCAELRIKPPMTKETGKPLPGLGCEEEEGLSFISNLMN